MFSGTKKAFGLNLGLKHQGLKLCLVSSNDYHTLAFAILRQDLICVSIDLYGGGIFFFFFFFFFFLVWFGFYGPFKTISLISSDRLIKAGRKLENPGKPPDHP